MGVFQNQEAYLGVDLGAHGIKVVELKKVKNRPHIWTYGLLNKKLDVHAPQRKHKKAVKYFDYEQKDTNQEDEKGVDKVFQDERVEVYASLLKKVLKDARVTANRATASLPVSEIFHTLITLPKVDKKDLKHHVHAKVKKLLPLPIDEMQIVFQIFPDPEEKRDYLQILVTAAPKSLVILYSKIFQKAGIILDELETEAFALERALVGRDSATSLVIDMGSERSNFFVIKNSLPITHRSIKIGGNNFDAHLAQVLGVSQDHAEQIKIDLASGTVDRRIESSLFSALLEPVVKEIQYSIDVYKSQVRDNSTDRGIEKIILTGGVAFFPPFMDYLKQKFPLTVFIGDPWARVVYQQGLKNVLDNLGPRMAVSVGLAMRNLV